MKNVCRPHSLVYPVGAALIFMTALAIAGMVLSILVTQRVADDAEVINVSGSLSMQSYRIATLLTKEQENTAQWPASTGLKEQLLQIDNLTAKLQAPGIIKATGAARNTELNRIYQRVLRAWQNDKLPALKSLLTSDPTSTNRQSAVEHYLIGVEVFAADIDNLAHLIQQNSERNIYWLRVAEGFIILLTIGAAVVVVFLIHTNLSIPARDLVQGINNLGNGDYSYRTRYHGNNELGLLSKTYNSMTEHLATQHGAMEALMAEKTQDLQTNNQLLEYLYRTSRRLLDNPHSPQLMVDIVEELVQLTGLKRLSLCIYPTPDEGKFELIEPPSSERDVNCEPNKCLNCWKKPENLKANCRPNEMSVPIRKKGEEFGFMYVAKEPDNNIDKWNDLLVKSTADMLSVTLLLRQKEAQDQRLILMEERAVIARELHDSLIQSLSYMKIQVAWVNTQMERGCSNETLASGIDKFSNVLNSAYLQLRELLTTFRLKMDKPTLQAALAGTVAEFEARSGSTIDLTFDLYHCPLTSNEDINILQIVREALSNAVKHSHASKMSINCRRVSKNKAAVTIYDNGIGISDKAENHHYGMAIMEERARSLNGQIQVRCPEQGGTEIELLFTPQQAESVTPLH